MPARMTHSDEELTIPIMTRMVSVIICNLRYLNGRLHNFNGFLQWDATGCFYCWLCFFFLRFHAEQESRNCKRPDQQMINTGYQNKGCNKSEYEFSVYRIGAFDHIINYNHNNGLVQNIERIYSFVYIILN